MKPSVRNGFKPSYRMTRRWNWISFVLSWAILLTIVIAAIQGSQEAVALAPVFVPSLCVMIAALIGIHRYTGAMDYQSAMSTGTAAESEER
ncbi:NAD(P)+ transhydrogenase beta chain [Rhizobium sullae]|uniref:NAD(P)+ transhydrogenase beta chain n=1 Tax=Rhizobium sullae TaxID=50338 RepID=A0ABY5XGB6_RHISU|nr:hypothetical protein [Rhizobium sullae]UWU13254.1 NAD(P)+ transhydrogenase beta chain [Rhizobium sullae]